MLVVDPPRMRHGAIRAAFRSAAPGAEIKADVWNLRYGRDLELRSEQWVLRWEVEDRKFIRRQRLSDLRDPVIPRVAAPEIINPQKPTLFEVEAHGFRIFVGNKGAPNLGRHHERTIEYFRIGEADEQMIRFARGVLADVSLRQ